MTPSVDVYSYAPSVMAARHPLRRRAMALLVVLGIAGAGALIGRYAHPTDTAHVVSGPYNYFPI